MLIYMESVVVAGFLFFFFVNFFLLIVYLAIFLNNKTMVLKKKLPISLFLVSAWAIYCEKTGKIHQPYEIYVHNLVKDLVGKPNGINLTSRFSEPTTFQSPRAHYFTLYFYAAPPVLGVRIIWQRKL